MTLGNERVLDEGPSTYGTRSSPRRGIVDGGLLAIDPRVARTRNEGFLDYGLSFYL